MANAKTSPNGTVATLSEGVEGASPEELQLALTVFQQATFQEWQIKLLAGNFQRRLDSSLKAR